jgi:hypothetical protein
VGDEAKKATAVLSDWVTNLAHARALSEPGHLLIVVTHCEHPAHPGGAVVKAAATAAARRPPAGNNGSAVGGLATIVPASRYQRCAADVSAALRASVRGLAGVTGVTVSTQPGIAGELDVAVALRHSQQRHGAAQVFTKVLFRKHLSGGWPDAKRTTRKLTEWLRDEVGCSCCAVAKSNLGERRGVEEASSCETRIYGIRKHASVFMFL